MKRSFALLLPLMAAACSTQAPPLKQIAAAPVATPPPAPAPVLDWRDRPYTSGLWRYADRTASFGPAGVPPLLTIRCDVARRLILLSVQGALPTLTIRTSYAER